MNINEILNGFHQKDTIDDAIVMAIQSDKALRWELVCHFRKEKDHAFTVALLDRLIQIRRSPDGVMPAEDLQLASYLLGLHGQVADSLHVWRAKTVDFDTYCGLDIQLVVFAGVKETIAYLEHEGSAEAGRALEYVLECAVGGDLDDIEGYFSANERPWFV